MGVGNKLWLSDGLTLSLNTWLIILNSGSLINPNQTILSIVLHHSWKNWKLTVVRLHLTLYNFFTGSLLWFSSSLISLSLCPVWQKMDQQRYLNFGNLLIIYLDRFDRAHSHKFNSLHNNRFNMYSNRSNRSNHSIWEKGSKGKVKISLDNLV